jgi:hypothetical protein
MKARGIDPNGPEAKLFGRKLVRSLTEAFGVSILLGGFFHADPHPVHVGVRMWMLHDIYIIHRSGVQEVEEEGRGLVLIENRNTLPHTTLDLPQIKTQI